MRPYLDASRPKSGNFLKLWLYFCKESSMILICDFIELRISQQWERSGLQNHPPATTRSQILLSFYLNKFAMLSCDRNKKVEPNNWGEKKEQGNDREQAESDIPLFQISLWSEEMWTYSSSCHNTVTYLQKNHNQVFVNCFRILHILHTVVKNKILPKRKFRFDYFHKQIMTGALFTAKVLLKTDVVLCLF